MSSALLSVDHIHLTYAGMKHQTLQDISLSLKKGEILSLVGESGSGKSSLLRVIAGFERPEGGSVTLDGLELTGTSNFTAPQQRGIGFVSQQGDLFPHLTISQNICYGMRGASRKEKAATTHTLLDQIQLPGYADKYPSELSGGEKQRVALARALALQPRLLLLDEPFSSLDTRLRKELLELTFRLLRHAQTTAIFVTHHSTDALRVGDQLGVMHQGRLMQVGTPQAVWDAPASMQVARLFYEINDYSGVPGPLRDQHHIPCWSRVRDLKIHPPRDTSTRLRASIVREEFLGQEILLTLHLDDCAGEIKCYHPADVPVCTIGDKVEVQFS